MDTIKAADSLVIEYGPGVWRLTNGQPNERPLLIATVGAAALAYRSIFAEARHLAASGELAVEDIEGIVVGWSRSDRSWHLGLLLADSLAQSRDGRWCELARWSDDYALLAAEQAEQAGASLAKVVGRKFRFVEAPHMAPTTGPLNPDALKAYVPPAVAAVASPATVDELASSELQQQLRETSDASAGVEQDWMKSAVSQFPSGESDSVDTLAAADPVATEASPVLVEETTENGDSVAEMGPQLSASDDNPEEIFDDDPPTPVVRVGRRGDAPPIKLPLLLGDWQLKVIDNGLQWARFGVWSIGALWSVFLRFALGVLFIVLSILTVQSAYASVQPEFLPYVGIVLGIGLIFIGLRAIRRMMRTESVVFDKTLSEVRRHLDLTSDVLVTYPFAEIGGVVITQVEQQKQRGRNGQPDRMTHEAWLHLLLTEVHQEQGKERTLKPEDAYFTFGHVEATEGIVVAEHHEGKKRARLPQLLYPEQATTPAQQAALVIARDIGVDAYIDQR